MNEEEKLKQRIVQLENEFKLRSWQLPQTPDPSLADDEWHAIFPDYRDLTRGVITKIPWGGGSIIMTSTFKVKRIL